MPWLISGVLQLTEQKLKVLNKLSLTAEQGMLSSQESVLPDFISRPATQFRQAC